MVQVKWPFAPWAKPRRGLHESRPVQSLHALTPLTSQFTLRCISCLRQPLQPQRRPAKAVSSRFWRASRQLFLELAGALFAVLALAWLNLALRSWTRDVARWLIATAVAVALLFVFFAVTSFRRARKL